MGGMAWFQLEHIAASLTRGGQVSPLFTDVNLSLEAGSIYDLSGPSGSGKSTLLRVCARMLDRSSGELYLDGTPSSKFAPAEWRRRVCLVPQKPSLVAGTVLDNLVLPWKLKVNAGTEPPSTDALAQLLVLAGLPDVEPSRDISQLSGGQAARVALLRAFATRPHVLLLDEADAALDAESAHHIGVLTRALVDSSMTCLRIRHREPDGFAVGTFHLQGGTVTYDPHGQAAGNAQLGSPEVQQARKAVGKLGARA